MPKPQKKMMGLPKEEKKANIKSAVMLYVLDTGDVGFSESVNVNGKDFDFNKIYIGDLTLMSTFMQYLLSVKFDVGMKPKDGEQ